MTNFSQTEAIRQELVDVLEFLVLEVKKANEIDLVPHDNGWSYCDLLDDLKMTLNSWDKIYGDNGVFGPDGWRHRMLNSLYARRDIQNKENCKPCNSLQGAFW